MIHEDSFTVKWIKEKSKENNKIDPILVEKVIRAFSLLENLQQSGIDFIFKGGTSLMLLLENPRRLSIDIDIIMTADQDIESALDQIQKSSLFIDRKLIPRKQAIKIEKQHYKMYYEPAYKTGGDREHILLDILIEENPYSETIEKEINSDFLKMTGSPITVKVPSIEPILADKLTAYPPNTTGIPYIKNEQGMGLQIIKQLFDISGLIDNIEKLDGVKPTFDRIAKIELDYRQNDSLTISDVLNDIIETSLCISSRGAKGEKGDFQELQAGIKSLISFVFLNRHDLDTATIDSAKAAYVAASLKSGNMSLKKFKSPDQVTELELKGDYPKVIRKFQRSNPEAYFYWCQVSHLLEKE